MRVKGGDIAQVRRIADRFSPRVSFEERTGWGRVRTDSLANLTITTLPDDPTRMPDVRGMGLKDALFLLERCGLSVRFSGQGAVATQSIAPGTAIKGNEKVEIRLQ